MGGGFGLSPTLMFYLISILIIGTSFAPFIFHRLDIWHSQGMWVQICLCVAFSWSFFEKKREIKCPNIPMGLLHLWVGLFTGYICYVSQVNGKYNIDNFLPYFNFLCLLIFYNLIVQHLNSKQIEKILEMFRYVIIGTMILCVLQYFNLGQFFKMFSPENANYNNNPIVGMIGNGTHLSGFLASTVPLFLWKARKEDWLALALMGLILTQTGSSLGDPAVSGFIVAFVVVCYFYRKIWLVPIGAMAVIGLCVFKDLKILSDNGRFAIWKTYLDLFKQMPLTGTGLGTVNNIYKHTPTPNARHLHMEFFQYTFELGLIGIVLIANVVKGFFSNNTDDKISLVLKGCVLGFLVSCCFNYPAHLWLPSTFALFCYASLYAIKNEEILCQFHQEKK